MPRAYSADMRARVIGRVESGASRREAAEHYDVSASTAVIWVKCFRETGRCAAKPRGGSISPLEEHAEFLLALIEQQADLTLDEVIAVMRKHRIAGSRTAVWRFFQRHKISFKKSLARGGAGACGRGASPAALDARTAHVRPGPAGVHR
jgi:transposase